MSHICCVGFRFVNYKKTLNFLKHVNMLNFKYNKILIMKRTYNNKRFLSINNNYMPTTFADRIFVKYYSYKCDSDEIREIEFDETENLSVSEIVKRHESLSLYTDSNDPIILQLSNCNTVQDILNIVKDENLNLHHTHLCHAIVCLYNLQRVYYESYIENLQKYDIDKNPEKEMQIYLHNQNSNSDFKCFMKEFFNNFDKLSIKEAIYCAYFLKNMDIQTYFNSEYLDMSEKINVDIIKSNELIDCDTIAKYTDFIKIPEVLKFAFQASKIIPVLMRLLSECKTGDDFLKITLSLSNVRLVVTKSLLEIYKQTLIELMDTSVITSTDYKIIVKVIAFLNFHHWSSTNLNTIKNLCNFVVPMINNMDAEDVTVLHRVFQEHMEPISMYYETNKRIQNLLEKSKYDDSVKMFMRLPSLMHCHATNLLGTKKNIFYDSVVQLVKKGYTPSLLTIYDIIKVLKIGNSDICDILWMRLVDELLSIDKYNRMTLHLSHIYLYFINSIMAKYRSKHFERVLIDRLENSLQNDYIYHVPWKYCRLVAFLVAFKSSNDITTENVLNDYIDKLSSIYYQLSAKDIMYISRIIKVSKRINPKNLMKYPIYKKINLLVDKYTKFKVQQSDISLSDLNYIVKSNINSNHKNYNYDLLFTKYNNYSIEDLTSQNIKQIFFNFISSNTFVKPVLDRMIEYILKNQENVSANIICKVLFCYFLSGTIPNKEIFNVGLNAIERDIDILNANVLIESSLAMCFFGYMNEDILKHIFSLNFMEKIDNELNSGFYHKAFALKLRNKLMILNRAVCLELPQFKIPWFHEKYLQGLMLESAKSLSYFQLDVLDSIINVVGSKQLVQPLHYSPYGYMVDFYLRKCEKKFISPCTRLNEMNNTTRFAFLLQKKESLVNIYDLDYSNKLILKKSENGTSQLRSRHLEQMGYQVIKIYDSLWNSMHMSEPKAKINFIQSKLSY